MSRESMNMGSSNSNIISQLKATMSELQQGFSSMRHEASSFFTSLNRPSGILGGASNMGGNVHPNQVAPNPVFSNTPSVIGMTESGNIVAAGPSASMSAGSGFSSGASQPTLPGMENLGQYVAKNPGSGTVYTPAAMVGGGGTKNLVSGTTPLDPATGQAISSNLNLGSILGVLAKGAALQGIASSFLPGADEVVQTDLLMKRINFLGGNANRTTLDNLANQGTATSSLDALNAANLAGEYGLMAGGGKFMTGVANASNLTPGMGIQGAMQATVSMQQASSVNMLRGIGIQIRNADGTLVGPDKVIDDVWDKICKDYKQAYGPARNGGKPSREEVQIALQPGNSLDSMLNQYFGGDPMLKNMVMNGLLYRAQQQGAVGAPQETGALSGAAQGTVASVTSTTAIQALTGKYAATTSLLTAGASSAAGTSGFAGATDIITEFINKTAGVVNTILPKMTFLDTLLSAAGGAPTDAISFLAGLFGARAEGGPVQGGTAYLVGEKGPELFVPSVSGAIVSNDQIQPNQNKNSGTITGSSNNTYNFNINIPNANTPEVIAELRKLLSNLETNKIVSES